jgi:hypothetical protein
MYFVQNKKKIKNEKREVKIVIQKYHPRKKKHKLKSKEKILLFL